MRPLFTIILISLFANPLVQGQTNLGYLVDLQGSLAHTNFKKNATDQLTGTALDLRANVSLLGNLFFKRSKFMIGDHIGAGLGMGFWKKPEGTPTSATKNTSTMLCLDLQLGIKAAYAINDDIDIGIKYMLGAGDIFIDNSVNDFTLALGPAIIPSVRVGPAMASVGFGTGITGGGSGNKGNFAMAEGRFLLSEGRKRNLYVFLRFESYSGKTTDYKQKANQAFLGIGFM